MSTTSAAETEVVRALHAAASTTDDAPQSHHVPHEGVPSIDVRRRRAATQRPTDLAALKKWAAELAANHRALVPTVVTTHEDLGHFLANLAGAYLAGIIERAQFQDLLVWAMTFLQNIQAGKGQKLTPMLVVRRP